MLPGSPPLWLTRSGSEYFVNGAQVQNLSKVFSSRHYIALEEILYLGIRLDEDWSSLLGHGFKAISDYVHGYLCLGCSRRDTMFTDIFLLVFLFPLFRIGKLQSLSSLNPREGKEMEGPSRVVFKEM
jgi:hypothetical protein